MLADVIDQTTPRDHICSVMSRSSLGVTVCIQLNRDASLVGNLDTEGSPASKNHYAVIEALLSFPIRGKVEKQHCGTFSLWDFFLDIYFLGAYFLFGHCGILFFGHHRILLFWTSWDIIFLDAKGQYFFGHQGIVLELCGTLLFGHCRTLLLDIT